MTTTSCLFSFGVVVAALVLAAAAAIVPAPAAAASDGFAACQIQALDVLVQGFDDDVKCAALQRFNQCLNRIGASNDEFATLARYLGDLACDTSANPDESLLAGTTLIDEGTYERTRRETTNLTALAARLDELEARLENVASADDIAFASETASSIGTYMDARTLLNRRLAIQTAAFGSTTDGALMAAEARVSTIAGGLADLATRDEFHDENTRLTGDSVRLATDARNTIWQQDQDFSYAISTLEDAKYTTYRDYREEIRGQVSAETSSLRSEINGVRANIESKLSATESAITLGLQEAGSVVAGHEGVMSNMAATVNLFHSWNAFKTSYHGWSGYCSSHGRSNRNWVRYCTNVEEWSTSEPYFFRESTNGQFRMRVAGYVRINYWGISHCSAWAHVAIYVNGSHRYHGHEHAHNQWTDNFGDLTWYMNANDYFWVQIYCYDGSVYNYHSGNSGGSHSRLQVTYISPSTAFV